MSVSDQITEDIENDKYEDEIVFEEPSGWLLSHDILETVGYSIGFLVFLGILALILYLKCRNKRTSTTLVPWFDNLHHNVQMVGVEPKFESLHQPVGYVAAAQPQPENQNWGNSCHEMTFIEGSTACQQTPL